MTNTPAGDAPKSRRTKRKSITSQYPIYESRFRKLVDSDLMGIGIANRFGEFTEANDELLRITGYTREDLEAGFVRWDMMTPSEYRESDAHSRAEAARRGNCTPYEKEYIRKDGGRIPIVCGYALLEGSQDEYISFVQDLTARRRAQTELRERERRFQALAENLPQMVWTTDPFGVGLYCNSNYLGYAGFSSQEEVESRWLDLIHPADVQKTFETWAHSLATGKNYTCEFRKRRHDGVYRHQLARAVPVRDPDGQIKLWLGSTTDVEDQKRSEEILRRTESLAAISAHQLNDPITSIAENLSLALMDSNLTAATRNHLRLAYAELSRIAQTTARGVRPQQPGSLPASTDVCEIMDSVLNMYAKEFETRGIRIERQYRSVQKLHSSPEELRQVFAHLLSNSLNAMTQSGGGLRIRIRDAFNCTSPGRFGIQVTIADSGRGIPACLVRRIFEPFVSTRQSSGTGLGLWLVDSIVRKQSGRIALRSRTSAPHQGTIVSIFFPFLGISH